MGRIYLHSSMSDSRQWRALHNDFDGVLHDFYGYGEAPPAPPGPFSFAVEAARIPLNTAMTLIGHSYGAAASLHLASLHSQQARLLCLYEPVAFWLLPEESTERQEAETLARRMAGVDAATAARTFVNYWSGEGAFESLPARSQQKLASQAPKVMKDFEALIGEQSDPSNITAPMLLMVGKHSPASSRAVAFELARRLPQAELVEVDAGHMGPIQAPDKVLPVMADFLRRYG
ncbi:alpha/beta fold hydrolase [Gallaecimonas pentaromativorans]|uniref:Pimeloyl-ACP methyl ester carboxylesterase n=1 Tax=Gallaecimonas pentaromativorans TaxID=584787 RepID=A0A3N1PPL6_9GAMM|nr:alpha/beta hydrolase [Gallaecimonas pentaromativorans]ROQ30129.1 pimeloyl-ACP methyl ester carboxylesterase [Gallaecimonas pentaromativorans]